MNHMWNLGPAFFWDSIMVLIAPLAGIWFIIFTVLVVMKLNRIIRLLESR